MPRVLAALMVCTFVGVNSADAGLHLGMKMACKRYGEAWSSGSVSALRSATTAEFGQAWARLPADVFASLPRSSGGEVLATSKGNGTGIVRVATGEGIVEFHVVGREFNWTVADIYKPNDEGAIVSVRDSLNAACTMRDFAAIFTDPNNNTDLSHVTSDRFRGAIAAIPPQTLTRIRSSLKRVQPPQRPSVHFRPFGAVVTVPTNPNERVIFHVVRENGWKVDDMGFATGRLEVASMRKNLQALATISDFGAFCRGDRSMPPAHFTRDGELCEELSWIHDNGKPFPGERQGSPHRLRIDSENRWVEAFWGDRRVTFKLAPGEQRGAEIVSVKVHENGSANDLASMLATYRKIQGVADAAATIKLLGFVLDSGNE